MQAQPVRVAVIGAGNHARQVLIPALQLCPGIRIVALATARQETAAAIGTRLGYPTVVGAAAALARDDVEAVVVAAPGAMLAELTAAALRAGKHVFCETPGVRSPKEALAVGRALSGTGLALAYGTCLRYAPIYQKLRALLPEIRASGNVVLTLRYYVWLRHTYDLALYLLGDVAAVTCRRVGNQIVTLLEFASGDLGVVHGGGPANVGVPLELVEASGAAGLLSARNARDLWCFRTPEAAGAMDQAFDDAPATVWAPTGSLPYRDLGALSLRGYVPELEAFAQAVRTGEPTLSGLDQAERTLRLERAVARSADEGKTIAVEAPFPLV